MNKFLKSVKNSVVSNKDELIKKSITTQLSNFVKEIQYFGVESKSAQNVDISEASNALCTTLEAMFLHGLKDSLAYRFTRAIADVDERPEPSFWGPLLVISHRQIIDQIVLLSQITTEAGQCRAWIRLALNDCLLSSYLVTLRQLGSSLKSFYKTGAYVRDAELLDLTQRLVEGVESFHTFTLPCNSSLLNTWPLQSLYLAGIWSPTLKACPVAPCDDVAQSINETSSPQPIPDIEVASVSSLSLGSQASGLRQIVSFSEDEVLKIILNKDKDNSCSSQSESESKTSEAESSNVIVGNSLKQRSGWSFDENQQDKMEETDEEQPAVEPPKPANEPKSTEASFNALIESYNMLSGGFIRTPDLRDVWQRFEDDKREESPTEHSPEVAQGSPISPIINKSESTALAIQVVKICREKGLNSQNFECMGCQVPLKIANKPKICAFTGEYYCASCMSPELITIPARIIHNWDFKLYEVSQKAFNYIDEIKDHPTIDFKIVNPFIYGAVEEMARLQILRNQLNFLRAYLYSCREPIIKSLQKKMWPREYMYEHIHQYSVADLAEIKNGVLASLLQKVVEFGREHVYGCWLCSQKGFLCEVCNKPKPLFPFDVENTYRCDNCSAVYHKGCLNSLKPCPKCERRKKREDLPLLGAITLD
ncbi:unnamed protein product [Brassicogethes aeneus]|uniref:RUN domain-containing protein n=1 Tax=Brassicogethes aeneus TaxID=1431903 RepID=A0A9P0BF25_BRAAE|nr:unnamed protein product [Brassicogethes aeneus]